MYVSQPLSLSVLIFLRWIGVFLYCFNTDSLILNLQLQLLYCDVLVMQTNLLDLIVPTEKKTKKQTTTKNEWCCCCCCCCCFLFLFFLFFVFLFFCFCFCFLPECFSLFDSRFRQFDPEFIWPFSSSWKKCYFSVPFDVTLTLTVCLLHNWCQTIRFKPQFVSFLLASQKGLIRTRSVAKSFL